MAGLFDFSYETYAQVLNVLHQVQSNGFWYSFCKKFMVAQLVGLIQEQDTVPFVKLIMILIWIHLKK